MKITRQAPTLTAVAAIFTGLFLSSRAVFTTATVVGSSMSPALRDGQRLLIVYARWRHVRLGDVIVFTNPRKHAEPPYLIKRVVAKSGEVSPFDHALVPPHHVIVRGDNPVSLDSRQLGPINECDILGVCVRQRG